MLRTAHSICVVFVEQLSFSGCYFYKYGQHCSVYKATGASALNNPNPNESLTLKLNTYRAWPPTGMSLAVYTHRIGCLLLRTSRWCLVMPLQMWSSHTFISCHHVFILLKFNATYRMEGNLNVRPLDLQANAPTAELPTPHSHNVSWLNTHELLCAV